ncbi:MAG: redoxin family protein [Planctomycetota bacterium]
MRCFAAAAALAAAGLAQSRPRVLEIGVEAPALRGLTWLQGEPVTVEKGKVLVVEFWATWCSVCRVSIPTLTRLQRSDDGDVRVVGIASARFESGRERVESFVAQWKPRIGYAIAWDGQSTAAVDWLDAAGQRGLPVTFVVGRDRRVAWIGTPTDGLSDVVSRIAAGAFDIEVARKVSALQRELSKATVRGDRSAILDVTERWIGVDPNRATPWISRFRVLASDVAGLDAAEECTRRALTELAKTPSELARFANEGLFAASDATACHELGLRTIAEAFRAREDDPRLAIAYFSALAATKRDEDAEKAAWHAVELARDDATLLASLAGDLTNARYGKRFVEQALAALHRASVLEPDNHSLERAEFDILALVEKDDAAAREVGQRLLRSAAHDDALLNEFAWSLLDSPSYRGRFEALALRASEIVHALPNGSNWAYVDTLARAKYVNGFIDEAVRLQRQAVERCDARLYMGDLRQRLRIYEKAAAEKRK